MPFRTATMRDERISFVIQASQAGANKSQLCRTFGITRRTGDKWLKRYQAAESLAGVEEASRRPHMSPTQSSPELVQQIVQLRLQHDWGARKLLWLLSQAGVPLLPSESTVNRILKREGLVATATRDPIATRRFERAQCNELWQMDFKGPYPFREQWCHPLTVEDDHSRFLLSLTALPDQTTAEVQVALVATFERYGVPEGMLMDHGTPWWSNSNEHGLTRLGVFLINQRIRLLFGRVRHPQTQGKVERLHRTLQAKMRKTARLQSLSDYQARFDWFRQEYNEVRPHESLAMACPTSRFVPSRRGYRAHPPAWEYPTGAVVVTLNSQGFVPVGGRRYFVSEALAGQRVQLEHLDDKLAVRYRHMYVREIDLTTHRSVTLLVPADQPRMYTMS